jgi:uncharacterized protein with FMN-binding domain
MKVLMIVGIVAGVILVLAGIMFVAVTAGMGEIKKMAVAKVDPSMVPDGVYHGRFSKNRWTFELEITVKDHRIVSIKDAKKGGTKLETEKDFFDKAAAAITEKQSTDIDVVSGATVHTRAFRKAVEDALVKARRQ